jgi:hypothetical protein
MTQENHWRDTLWPTIAASGETIVGLPGTTAMIVPLGDTGDRPLSPVNGMMRFNTDSTDFEVYNGGWAILTSSAGVTLSKLEDGNANTQIFVENFTGADDNIIAFTMGDSSGTYIMPASVLEWSTAGFGIETPTGNASNAGVGFTITTGDGNIAAAGGDIGLTAGDGGASGDGGNIILTSGAGSGGGSAGAVVIPDSTAPSVTTNKLYSVGGALTWNGTNVSGGGGGGLNNVVEDTTPQLGGDLDVNGFDITTIDGAGNGITITTSAAAPSTSSGSVTVAAANSNAAVNSLIAGQDETDYTFDFNGGTGYVVTEVITMADGSTVTVNTLSGSSVLTFTVTTSGGVDVQIQPHPTNLIQSSTTGSGTGFLLQPQGNNVVQDAQSGGNLTLSAGDGGTTTSGGGDVVITSGRQRGEILIKSGDARTTGNGAYAGQVDIEVGTSWQNSGENLTLQAGHSDYQGGDSFGGDVRIIAGVGYASTGIADNSYGGDVIIEAGPGYQAPFSAGFPDPDQGGRIDIRSGDAYFSGGDVNIISGTSSNSFAGDIVLSPGSGPSSDGAIIISTSTAPSSTTNKLYNVAGALTWNGTDLTAAGSGNVIKVGTPVNNQIGVWTGNGTLEGDSDFTWDGTTLTVNGDIALNGNIAAELGFEIQTGLTYGPGDFTTAHSGKMVTMDNASPNTVTLPSNASLAYPIGTEIHFQQLGAGTTAIAIDTDTLNVNANLLPSLNGQYAVATALKVTATTWTLFGNLVPF